MEIIIAVGDGEHLAHVVAGKRARVRFLQQAGTVGEPHESLGVALPGHRPQAGAGATGKYDWNQHSLHSLVFFI